MPPKKKAAAGTAYEIHPADYARKLVKPPVEFAEKLLPPNGIKGNIVNIESVFPEWNVVDESWDDLSNLESSKELEKLPSSLGAVTLVPIREYLKLDEVADTTAADKKSTPKKDAKPAKGGKGKAAPSAELFDMLCDAEGRQLPRVFCGRLPEKKVEEASVERKAVEVPVHEEKGKKGRGSVGKGKETKDSKGDHDASEAATAADENANKVTDDSDGALSGYKFFWSFHKQPISIDIEKSIGTIKESAEEDRVSPTNSNKSTSIRFEGDLFDEEGKKSSPEKKANEMIVDKDMCAAINLVQRFAEAVTKEREASASLDALAASSIAEASLAAPSKALEKKETSAQSKDAKSAKGKEKAPDDLDADEPVADNGMEFPYLWRAIYPQTATGRPCLNPAGKYAVKLFIGGKWRKVMVSDAVPVKADGSPAVVYSGNERELWPMLLAKAVYAVYTTCGYDKTIAALQSAQDMNNPSDEQSSSASVPVQGDSFPYSRTPQLSGAHFVSFALHCMTGWLPGTPWGVNEVLSAAHPREARAVQEMIFGGISIIPPSEIPDRDTQRHLKMHKRNVKAMLSPTSGSPGSQNGGMSSAMSSMPGSPSTAATATPKADEEYCPSPKWRTKKQFKDDYRRRLDELDALLHNIAVREGKIKQITEQLAVPCSEFFVLSIPSDKVEGTLDVYPVLGLVYPEICEDMLDVSFLLRWDVEDKDLLPPEEKAKLEHSMTVSETTLDGNEMVKQTHIPMSDRLAQPLPHCTHVEFKLVTVRELASKGAMCFGVDTRSRLSHRTAFGWHWAPVAAAAPPPDAKKDKGKPRASTVAADAPSSVYGAVSESMGMMPPMLLQMNTEGFHINLQNSLSKNVESDKDAHIGDDDEEEETKGGLEMIAEGEEVSDAGAVTEAHEEKSDPMDDGARAASVDAETATDTRTNLVSALDGDDNIEEAIIAAQKAAYLSVAVVIQSDLIFPSVPQKAPEEEDTGSKSDKGRRKSSLKVGTKSRSGSGEALDLLASSSSLPKPPSIIPYSKPVVVVLQELRWDNEDPLVMRVELSGEAPVPLTRVTFHIPADRVPPKKFVFWVRLYTEASVYVSICSGVELSLGQAGEMWSKMGYHTLQRSGESGMTLPNMEQILFRLPLSVANFGNMGTTLEALEDGDNAESGAQTFETDKQSGDNDIEVPYEPLGPPFSNADDQDLVYVFLHISNQINERSVSFLTLTDAASMTDASSSDTPESYSLCLPRTSGVKISIPGPGSLPKLLVARCYPPDGSDFSLPGFKWTLTVLCRHELAEPPAKLMTNGAVEQRYMGKYAPNNRLLLFREVLSADKASFPLALRIQTMAKSAFVAQEKDRGAILARKKAEDEALNPPKAAKGGKDGKDGKRKSEAPPSDALRLQTPKENKPDSIEKIVDINENLPILARIIRKEDKKCIAEYRARSLLQLYNLKLEMFDGPTDDASVADAGSQATASSPSKKSKGDGGKGKGEAAAPPCEFIIECSIDETRMAVPRELRSRLPFAYDGGGVDDVLQRYLGDSAPASHRDSSPDKKGDKKSDKKADKGDDKSTAEDSEAKNEFAKAAEEPRFVWKLDVLSGKLLSIGHDTSDLEQQAAVKNSWEEASEGRRERAGAAMQFWLSQKRGVSGTLGAETILAAGAAPEKGGKKGGKGDAGGEIESLPAGLLAKALSKAPIDLLPRLEIIEKNDPYEEFITVSDPATQDVIPVEVIAEARADRELERAACTEAVDVAKQRQSGLNSALRVTTAERVAGLIDAAKHQQKSLSTIWMDRERYRVHCDAQNESLKKLMDFASERLSVVAEDEEQKRLEAEELATGVSPKGKKKAPPPKKKK